MMAGKAFVDGNLVAEAEMMASIIERKETRAQPYDGKRTRQGPRPGSAASTPESFSIH